MKRLKIFRVKGSTALLPVFFRQYLNAREGWYSKKVGAEVIHFLRQKSNDSKHSANNGWNNQDQQQQWHNFKWNASNFCNPTATRQNVQSKFYSINTSIHTIN